MTTLVSLITKDSVVLGCDSLATSVKPLVDPYDLIDFCDGQDEPDDPRPTLVTISFAQLLSRAVRYPYDHMTHVDKLHSLAPLKMGVMITGISGLGDRTIKSLISEFIDTNFNCGPEDANKAPIEDIATNLCGFMAPYYASEYPDKTQYRPKLEFILAGYSKTHTNANSIRIIFPDENIEPPEGKFGIMFGGQTKEIQRIIFGIDNDNIQRIEDIYEYKLQEYHNKLTAYLEEQNITVELPNPYDFISETGPISFDWNLEQFDADWGNFSEQNAIECVHWLVEIMSKSQQFSSSSPTVGGETNIAIITKNDGFRFVSKREYQVGGFSVPR